MRKAYEFKISCPFFNTGQEIMINNFNNKIPDLRDNNTSSIIESQIFIYLMKILNKWTASLDRHIIRHFSPERYQVLDSLG